MAGLNLEKFKVLLIDDEAFIRSTIRQILHQLHIHNVYEAANALAGMRETLRIRPQLIFCDIHMPDENGLEYVAKLRLSSIGDVAATPVVMLTSENREAAVKAAKGLKVEGYLVKPVSADLMKQSIERALEIELP
jgi:two-component system chemotaxis response regulator CheY